MIQEEFDRIAKDIIKDNIYLTLATSLNDSVWAAPVYYDIDNEYNFYYISQLTSLHTKNVLKNPRVAFAIFDSRQKADTGNGVQGIGNVYLLKDNELNKAFKIYKSNYIPKKRENFTGKASYRFFKIVPEKLYILDPEAKVDKRVEVWILK